MTQGREIREKFLKYFESKGHARVASASLLPANDPTLFFVNAGMVPFKDVFTGREKRAYTRATSSQKCMRVSGKHNDLENVGRTPRHHTFFEMLGNFSFGDYFKKEAIAFAWEFLTKEIGLDKDLLWITIFETDDEAGDIWHKEQGVPRDRIVKCGEKDNFWSMGETGPCGPCSEIHVDLKKLHGTGVAKGDPSNSEDFMEIWNLVFMQYDRSSDGKLNPLPKPSIDTGMGLERLAAVLQKTKSNYDTDLFMPIIETASKRTKKKYGSEAETDVSLRVLADHIRAAVFLVGDGIQPSNEGRGYVLRRIMRRAIRHGRLLGMREAFFFELIEPTISLMGGAYPDLISNQAFITKVIRTEEESFLKTLESGLQMIDNAIAETKASKGKILDGVMAFKLYDTFGFPIDLTEIIAEENGLSVDMSAFDREMEAQKKRARAAWKGSGQEKVGDLYHKLAQTGKTTLFEGYATMQTSSTITAILNGETFVESVNAGDQVEIFVKNTPFYGESGGQVGDVGQITSQSAQLKVTDTQKPVDGIFSHHAVVEKGSLKVGDEVSLTVDSAYRKAVMVNHTATHIMHAALRTILGDHVKQAGSVVDANKLRFDFSHFEALSSEQIEALETQVNQVIQANSQVTKEEMSLDDAKKKGALAFFGDKYGDRVRVVTVGDHSMEFCGGTHLNAAGEIGLFKIMGESSVASGVRRIEAITGMTAIQEFQKMDRLQREVAATLKTTPAELPERVAKLSEKTRELEREITKLKSKLASGGGSNEDYLSKVEDINGVRFLALEVDIDDAKALREFSDEVKNRLQSGIAVIASGAGDKAAFLVTVSKDLTERFQAGKLVAQIAAIVGGKGGGRPDMAQAGGPDVSKIKEALTKARELIAG